MAVVECPHCRAANELPGEALAVGRYRCHACGQVAPVPEELRAGGDPAGPQEPPVTHGEPVQALPSYTPSRHNTPEAMRRAEEEASRVGCLVAILGLARGG